MRFAAILNRPILLSYLVIFALTYSFSVYADVKKDKQAIHLKETETSILPGTNITIAVKSVIDLTSKGCLGGPIGCRDRVIIEIIDGTKSQNVTLEIPKTPEQKKQKIDQTIINDKILRLTGINKKEADFVVEESLQGRSDR
jgi:hypothetical protein